MAQEPNLILPLYQKLLSNAKKYLRKIKRLPKKSVIHKSRLVVKNMIGLEQLLGENNALAEINSVIYNFYKCAGKIREAQINRYLAKEYILNKKIRKIYRKHQNQILADKNLNLKLLAKTTLKSLRYVNSNSVYNSLEIINNEKLNALVKDFMVLKSNYVIEQLSQLNDFIVIHNIRKQLKAIKTIYNVVKTPGALKTDCVYLDLVKAEEKIGVWHDQLVFCESLVDFHKAQHLKLSGIDSLITILTADSFMFIEEIKPTIEALTHKIKMGWA